MYGKDFVVSLLSERTVFLCVTVYEGTQLFVCRDDRIVFQCARKILWTDRSELFSCVLKHTPGAGSTDRFHYNQKGLIFFTVYEKD